MPEQRAIRPRCRTGATHPRDHHLPDECAPRGQPAPGAGEIHRSIRLVRTGTADLCALHRPPDASYRLLSRYDETGLIWSLRGRPVVALAEGTAAIENPTGAITVYRKNNKPMLGPVGDSLDDLDPRGPR
jgi:hypothetical protein